MAFDNIKANLRILENSDHITTEDLIDSMYRLFNDVKSANNVDSINDFCVDNIENYGIKLLNLLAVLERSYKKEEQRLKELDDEDINELITHNNEIIKKLEEIEPRLEEIRKADEENNELQKKYDDASVEIEALKKKLESFEEISISELEAKKEELEKTITARDDLQTQMRDFENELSKLKTEISSLEEITTEKANEKSKKESELEGLKKLNDEYDIWKKNFPHIKSEIEKNFSEAQSAFLFIQNAWNSLVSGEITYDSRPLPDGLESFSDVEEWFKNESMEIEKRIDTFIATYKALIAHEKEEE